MYQYFYDRFHFLNDSNQDWVRLVNNSKENPIQLLNMSVLFWKGQKEYIAVFEMDEIWETSRLDFACSNPQYSSLFLNYIFQFLTSLNPCFYKIMHEIVIHDYHNDLYKLKVLKMSNMFVTKNIIDAIQTYFPQLKQIAFEDCTITKSCSFKDFHSTLFLNRCEIEDLFSLQEFENELYISDSKIDCVRNTIIQSPKLQMSGEELSDEELAFFFSQAYFPRLESLEIGETLSGNYSKNKPLYRHSLYWISVACPKLLTLSIQGMVYSFDFLYSFHNLSNCEIQEETDSNISFMHQESLDRILKLLSQIHYTKEEENIYFRKDISSWVAFLSSMEKDKKLKNYFERSSTNRLELHSGYGTNYQMVGNQLYEIKPLFKTAGIIEKPKVILPHPFIYHPSGIPILLSLKKDSKEEISKCLKK